MFFILSKTISFLAMPLTLVSLAWLAFLLIKKKTWKRRLMWLALLLSFVFTNNFLAQKLMYWWEIPATPISSLESYPVGVVLTGIALTDRELNDRIYFARGADRIVNALQLYKAGKIQKVLISGGTGRIDEEIGFPEAIALRDFLLLAGVPESDIILETQANNTYENAKFSAEILAQQFPNQKILLITSAFHMRRSAACFSKQGVDLDTFTGDFFAKDKQKHGLGDFLIPNPDALNIWTKLFKEWIGMIAYKVAGYI
ncbi:YdcF family protein [Peijinzhouia sedimentorum]